LSLTVDAGLSVWASQALVAVAEQFAQESRVSTAEPIHELEWYLVFEEE
jgi:hypothetical protein